MNNYKQSIVCSVVLAVLLSLLATTSFSQRLNFLTSSPDISKYPTVSMLMTASYNGSLPNPVLGPGNFYVTEDGTAVNVQLQNCDDSREAAIVFCVDASTSMLGSVGDLFDIHQQFFGCFGDCITKFNGTSRYGLVTFYDDILNVYPPSGHPGGFYFAGNAQDSSDFVAAVRSQPYFGGTNVDIALDKAISLLQNAPFQQRAIVLVTDDAPINIWRFDSLMKLYHITLYVMEVGSDPAPHSLTLSHWTGGTYFQAKDTTDWGPVMSQLGELISGEHCMISYVSPNPCPWYANHDISLTLNYKSLQRTATQSYSLGIQKTDITAPTITETSPVYTSRTVAAFEDFPCGRGLHHALDSVKQNFILLSRNHFFKHYFPKVNGLYRDSSYIKMQDSLIVNDTMQNARAIYVAYDSAGNRNAVEILYQPVADVLPPVLNISQSSGGKYTIAATEVRPWDRGLTQIRMGTGAVNMALDSTKIFSKKSGSAWVHVVDLTQPAHCCVEALDSAGNIGTYCIDRTIVVDDTLPPVISQAPVISPYAVIQGTVTEQRPKDKGIKDIVLAPSGNVGPITLNYTSKASASFSVPIIDKLQPIRAVLSSSDSVGNATFDTLRYDPLLDTNSPVCVVDAPTPEIRIFRTTDLAPWDRGIASITIVGTLQNMTASAVTFTSRFEAQQTFTVTDPNLPASVVVRATDSVGHDCVSTITIDANPKSLIPLQVQSNVDFLKHLAPFDSVAVFSITNPNETPVQITNVVPNGDVNLFSCDLLKGTIFQPFEQKQIQIHFTASLIGKWNASFTIRNDTMTLATIAATAITTGEVKVSLESVNTPHSLMPETFHLKVSAVPTPINLDILSFDLHFDGDLISPAAAVIDCGTANELCNYSITSSMPTIGVMHFELKRIDLSKLATLTTTTTELQFPFTTYVTRSVTSLVTVEGAYGGDYATVIADTGLVTQGNECGDAALRAFMNNKIDSYIFGIVPNPATTSAMASINSAINDQPVTISLVDQLGSTVLRKDMLLKAGVNQIMLDLNAVAQGRYIVALQKDHSVLSTMPMNIVR